MNVQRSTEPFLNGKYLFKVNTTDNMKRCPEALLVSLLFKLNMLFFFVSIPLMKLLNYCRPLLHSDRKKEMGFQSKSSEWSLHGSDIFQIEVNPTIFGKTAK